MSELKPCPFCGGEAVSFSEDDGWTETGENSYRAYAGCHNPECGIGFELFHIGDDLSTDADDQPDGMHCYALEQQAIAAWNTRAERTCKIMVEDCDDGLDGDYVCSLCNAIVAEETDDAERG